MHPGAQRRINGDRRKKSYLARARSTRRQTTPRRQGRRCWEAGQVILVSLKAFRQTLRNRVDRLPETRVQNLSGKLATDIALQKLLRGHRTWRVEKWERNVPRTGTGADTREDKQESMDAIRATVLQARRKRSGVYADSNVSPERRYGVRLRARSGGVY